MIEPSTGSAILAVVQFVFSLAMVPTLLNRHAQVPRSSSGLTAAGLWVIAAVYALMGLLSAALASGLCATAWSLVFILRPVR